jgi:hypothetical protein
MRIHLVNPSDVSFGVAVITPRWLYVLASATPASFGDPHLVDETLEPFDLNEVSRGDIVGIGIHTANASWLRNRAQRSREARTSSLAAFIRRSIRTRPGNTAPHMPW